MTRREKQFEKWEVIIENLGLEHTFWGIIKAMSTQESEDMISFLARMHDINLGEEQ